MPMQPADRIQGEPRGSTGDALAFARQVGAARIDAVEAYLTEVYALAPQVGIDPAIVVAQSALETDNWRDAKWQERLNPAGMGVTDGTDFGFVWAHGSLAARGQLVHLWLYAKGRSLPAALAAFKALDPRFDAVPDKWIGQGRTLASLGGKWASVEDYGQRIANRARQVFSTLPDQRKESDMPLEIEVNLARNRLGQFGKLRDRDAWITVHENGNPNSDARAERNFVNNGGGNERVAYHFAVDRHRAVQIMPLDLRGTHAGNADGNATSIAIETSQQEDDTPNNQTQRNLRALIAAIISGDPRIDYGEGGYRFTIGRIRPHAGWPGANPDCPRRMLGAWGRTITPLLDGVRDLLGTVGEVEPHPVAGPHETKLINDKVFWKDTQHVVAPKDIRPKEWADPGSRSAPERATYRAGQSVRVQYVVIGEDKELWLVTAEGWRIPARTLVTSGRPRGLDLHESVSTRQEN